MDKRLLIEKVAIEKDGNAIMYTNEPSEELCMIAVRGCAPSRRFF